MPLIRSYHAPAIMAICIVHVLRFNCYATTRGKNYSRFKVLNKYENRHYANSVPETVFGDPGYPYRQ